MENLYIIGNGFDLAHNLKTSYNDFKRYLLKRIHSETADFNKRKKPKVPTLNLNNSKEGEFWDESGQLQLLFWLIDREAAKRKKRFHRDTDWSDFEDFLSDLDYGAFVKKRDSEEIANKNIFDIRHALDKLFSFFTNWMTEVDIYTCPKEKFEKKVDEENDLFLTFNYTETLESVYGVSDSRICYIHGKRASFVKYEMLKWPKGPKVDHLGANNLPLIIGYDKKKYNPEKYRNYDPEIKEGLKSLDLEYMKDTEGHINTHKSFFDQIKNSNISEVYSWGFSYSEVDKPYIKKVCEMLGNTKKVIWYIYRYGGNRILKKEMKSLRSCGFMGQIKTWEC